MNKLEFLFRWTHVFAGIVWIGHLYFFNFVNIQLQGKMDDPTKKLVNPHLMPRALWWFRMGAMVTFLSGLIMFSLIYLYTPGAGWGAACRCPNRRRCRALRPPTRNSGRARSFSTSGRARRESRRKIRPPARRYRDTPGA